jgi:hypothetical protein
MHGRSSPAWRPSPSPTVPAQPRRPDPDLVVM